MTSETQSKRQRIGAAPAEVARVKLNYNEPPPLGKRVGRYFAFEAVPGQPEGFDKSGQYDKGDLVDNRVACETDMHNGRLMTPPATCDSMGWSLENWPTKMKDFTNNDEVKEVYYEEIRQLVKKAAGARRVLVFDHTLRQSGSTGVEDAASAGAPVPVVHCDYTADGAPRRFKMLGQEGIYSHVRKRELTQNEVDALASERFAFINVWRPISEEPVERMPLAVCDCKSVPESDHFLYEMKFPNRTGETYRLRFSPNNKWYYYPRQGKDECLVFTVYDKREDGPRFVFHTAFNDPLTNSFSPIRRSCEVRTIAFFGPADVPEDPMASVHECGDNSHERHVNACRGF